ncbi:MAG: SurA N-terminal domain-containing protein [Syntrophorhabdaceae bacterium]|nr:SurA N-terminal domain-containing protein [Syntrophorhabdaceae bacterium]
MKMSAKAMRIVVMTVILFALMIGGCSKKDFNKQIVADVNGEKISVLELREYLGAPNGIMAFDSVPLEQKKNVLDQLIGIRLVVQAGRVMGIDNTPAYKDAAEKGEEAVIVDAMIRKEAQEKLKLDEKEVKEETDKIKKENEGISDTDAAVQASKAIIDRNLRQIQKDLVETAKKETEASIDNNVLEQIGKGKKISDDTVLASAGSEKILYSDVKKIISETPMLSSFNSQKDPEMAMALVSKIIEQDIVLRALKAYAAGKGMESSEMYKISRLNMERAVIANMMFDNVAVVPQVSDEEVMADYNRRAQMMQGDKSQVPSFGMVKEQLREILKNYKRQAAFGEYVEGLRNQGKVTVNEDVLKKV